MKGTTSMQPNDTADLGRDLLTPAHQVQQLSIVHHVGINCQLYIHLEKKFYHKNLYFPFEACIPCLNT